MDELRALNATRRSSIESGRDEVRRRHAAKARPSAPSYPLSALRARIAELFAAQLGAPRLSVQIDVSERARFGADLVLKVPALLSEHGAKRYTQDFVPRLVEALRASANDVFASIETKGIYINLRLGDRWLLESAQAVADLDAQFGESDAEASRTFVVDYSAPNVAKTLHAGHVRSTIIGHVLANLHEACGALVFRVNHINDFGGFGFFLEGARRFARAFPAELSNDQRLLELYALRRTLERHAEAQTPLEAKPEAERALLARYLPQAQTSAALCDAFGDWLAASERRFESLEAGAAEEVELWSTMVGWSLASFQEFYDLLGIAIDFTIGESFYVHAGTEMLQSALRTGRAIVFDGAHADAEIASLTAQQTAGELSPAELARGIEQLRKDIGAVVIPLADGQRLVALRADGRTIYATRDLGAIALRQELFHPTDVLYVVGQEQQVHFDRVFKAARCLGVVPDDTALRHIYFGFYVDAATGKKLSSRDSVANVIKLLTASIEHFRRKSAQDGDLTEQELDTTSRQLAVGSIVFNDLKQSMRSSVDITVGDLQHTIDAFEQSGGAYVVYAACRARAILRKYGKPVPNVSEIPAAELTEQEARLLLAIQELPASVARAAGENDPAILVRHLVELATLYNSYYFRSPVLKDGEVRLHRLAITRAVQIALTNGLRFCHIDCPLKI